METPSLAASRALGVLAKANLEKVFKASVVVREQLEKVLDAERLGHLHLPMREI